MFPGVGLYYADPAQPLATAGEETDDLEHDLSDASSRGVKHCAINAMNNPVTLRDDGQCRCIPQISFQPNGKLR